MLCYYKATTAAVEAGGTITHSTHVTNAKVENAPDTLYQRSNLKHLGRHGQFDADGMKGYQTFSAAATKAGKLSTKFKEIIVVSVATASQCPYCIDVPTKNAERQGGSNEELAEAVTVASLLRAGGVYAHMVNKMASYQE